MVHCLKLQTEASETHRTTSREKEILLFTARAGARRPRDPNVAKYDDSSSDGKASEYGATAQKRPVTGLVAAEPPAGHHSSSITWLNLHALTSSVFGETAEPRQVGARTGLWRGRTGRGRVGAGGGNAEERQNKERETPPSGHLRGEEGSC